MFHTINLFVNVDKLPESAFTPITAITPIIRSKNNSSVNPGV